MKIYEKLTDSAFVIAEIGSNHNGDISLAKKLIDAAKNAGCDAVKFQSWDWDTLFSKGMIEEQAEKVTDYLDDKGLEAIQKKLALSEDDHLELKKYCDNVGIIFCSTPFNEKQVDMLIRLEVPFLKVASLDLNNIGLLKYVARQKIPILLSIGMGDKEEIKTAIETIKGEGNEEIIILHCVALYPPENKFVNLKTIEWLRDEFKVKVGYSDHSLGNEAALGAVALGASVIEKHFMLDDMNCRDAKVSITPPGMTKLVAGIVKLREMLGEKDRILSDEEKSKRFKMRKSILAKCDLKKGEFLNIENIVMKRPGAGIPPDKINLVVGKKLKINKKTEDLIQYDDLE